MRRTWRWRCGSSAWDDPLALDFVDAAYFVSDGTLHLPDPAELRLWVTEQRES